MFLLEVGNLLPLVILAYIVLHSPAFILLGISWWIRESKPERSKKLSIIAVVYFVVGAGICGSMLLG